MLKRILIQIISFALYLKFFWNDDPSEELKTGGKYVWARLTATKRNSIFKIILAY